MPQSTNPGAGKSSAGFFRQCVRDHGDRIRLPLSSYLVSSLGEATMMMLLSVRSGSVVEDDVFDFGDDLKY